MFFYPFKTRLSLLFSLETSPASLFMSRSFHAEALLPLLFYIKYCRFQCRFYVCDETDSRFHGTSLPVMPRHSAYQHQRVYQSIQYYFIFSKSSGMITMACMVGCCQNSVGSSSWQANVCTFLRLVLAEVRYEQVCKALFY